MHIFSGGEDWASQGKPQGKAEIPVVTREFRRNSRKTTWFPPLGKMRPLPATRLMNQGKLEVVKQEMARVNVNILGISKLRWTEWVNLTQMTIISITVGRNPLEEME